MKLYAYGDGKGNWYQGRSPSGRVKYTDKLAEAVFFDYDSKDDAEDCLGLGLGLYAMELSEPIRVTPPTVTDLKGTGPSKEFSNWEVHSMDLFSAEP